MAIEERVRAELALGQHAELCGELEALVAEHPYREQLWAEWMLALYRAGRQADALRSYERVRCLFRDELGIEPGEALRDLEQSILLHTPDLDWSPSPPGDGDLGHDRPGVGPRHNLPVALTRFVGRDVELAEIGGLLISTRLVTLTGAGGVGKTRLAVEAAARVLEEFQDGVWFFELAPAADDAAVLATVAATFGITTTTTDGPDGLREEIAGYLASRRALVLFDNCEHVIDAVAPLVERVLVACPDVHVLATSRELLRVPGERTSAVPPLALPPDDVVELAELVGSDAVALFCEHAHDARPGFRLSDATAPAVVSICRRLDGIPLAIELAAARMRVLTAPQIAARLDNCFGLLGEGARTAVARQQTLRATLDWSFDLLSPVEQAALRRLAVFSDRFGLEAAIAVATETDVLGLSEGLDLVARLVDKSLVVADDTGEELRYRLLEPVRQYAAEKLSDAGETESAHRRHRDFFLARATVESAELLEAWTPLRSADAAHYHAALEWSWRAHDIDAALTLLAGENQRIEGRDIEARRWFERILADSEPSDDPGRARALAQLAILVHESGEPDPSRSTSLMREAMDIAVRRSDPALTAFIHYYVAELDLLRGRNSEARRLLVAAVDGFERHGSLLSAGWCHAVLGWVAVADGDQPLARVHFQRAADLARSDPKNGRWLTVHALAALGPVTVLLGDPEAGLQMADEAIVTARRLSISGGLIMALGRAAETAVLAGSPARAASVATELLARLRDQASHRFVADALEVAALLVEWYGENDTASELLRAADALRAPSGEPIGGTRSLGPAVREARDRLFTACPTPAADPLGRDAAIARALEAVNAIA